MTDPTPWRAFQGTMPLLLSDTTGNAPEYSGWMDEQLSWKQTCYIGDWTFVPQITLQGPDALGLLKELSVNDLDNFPQNRAKHCVQCDEDGKVISEGILLRLGEDAFEYQCGTPFWTAFNLEQRGYDAAVSFRSTYKLQVSGPTALPLLEALTRSDLRDVRFMRLSDRSVNDLDVTFLRQGMAGEIGFELQGPIEQRQQVYDAVLELGQKFGIRRLGVRSLPINHVEACYPTGSMHFFNALCDDRHAAYRSFVDAHFPLQEGIPEAFSPMRYNVSTSFDGSWDGRDISELYRSPVEMGWARNIAFDHEFIGRAALEDEVATPRRKVVTLEFDPSDLLRLTQTLFEDEPIDPPFPMPIQPYQLCWVDWILKDSRKIGHSTQPIYSRYFRRGLSLSFIDAEFAVPGTRVSVLWGRPGGRQMELGATVAPAPYKQTDRRQDLRTL